MASTVPALASRLLTTLDFFFDPGCPWTWMTSRWVADVAPRKDVPVRWRAYSMDVKNGGVDEEDHRPSWKTSRLALRVIEAVWADHGDEPIGRLYTEIGTRFHVRGDESPGVIAEALESSGLDPGYFEATHDDRWDAEIRGSMAEAAEIAGDELGVPLLVFRDGDEATGVFGPVLWPPPTGDEALALWDHVVELVLSPNFFELKRARPATPEPLDREL